MATSVASGYIKEFYANYIARQLCQSLPFTAGKRHIRDSLKISAGKGINSDAALLPHLILQQCIIRCKC